MDYDIREVQRLKTFEKTLLDLLKKLDDEIVRTNIEWLNLKCVAEEQNERVKIKQEPSTENQQQNISELNLDPDLNQNEASDDSN